MARNGTKNKPLDVKDHFKHTALWNDCGQTHSEHCQWGGRPALLCCLSVKHIGIFLRGSLPLLELFNPSKLCCFIDFAVRSSLVEPLGEERVEHS